MTISNYDNLSISCPILKPWILLSSLIFVVKISTAMISTVKPRFDEVPVDRPNLFVKSRVRYIENLDIANLSGNDQNVRYIEVIVND